MTRNRHALGPLEMEALGLLARRSPLSVHELRDDLARTGRDLAYTTVMTVLTRLHEKGLVSRRKEGRLFLYAPGKAAARAGESLLARVQRTLFGSERLKPIVTLLEDGGDLTVEELRELRALVDAKLKEKRSET